MPTRISGTHRSGSSGPLKTHLSTTTSTSILGPDHPSSSGTTLRAHSRTRLSDSNLQAECNGSSGKALSSAESASSHSSLNGHVDSTLQAKCHGSPNHALSTAEGTFSETSLGGRVDSSLQAECNGSSLSTAVEHLLAHVRSPAAIGPTAPSVTRIHFHWSPMLGKRPRVIDEAESTTNVLPWARDTSRRCNIDTYTYSHEPSSP